ncbi:MAG: Hpt domain-containing protein [Thermodesulfobacteriota bacterium]
MEAEIFRDEAAELLDDIEDTLLALKKEPSNQELINKLFRAAHTIKGSGAMFGFTEVSSFTHKFENAIDAIRQGRVPLNDAIIATFLEARDTILALLESEDPSAGEAAARASRIVTALAAIEHPATAAPPPPEPPAASAPPQSPSQPQPRPASATASETTAKNGRAVASTLPGLPSIKALVVEDEFVSRYVIQEFLHPLGSCHIAVNGFEAVLAFKTALVERQPYDLICLDIMMPGMDGRAVATEMRRLEEELGARRCTIIMTTAVSDQRVMSELFDQRKCDAYLIKPIIREELYKTILGCLGVQQE